MQVAQMNDAQNSTNTKSDQPQQFALNCSSRYFSFLLHMFSRMPGISPHLPSVGPLGSCGSRDAHIYPAAVSRDAATGSSVSRLEARVGPALFSCPFRALYSPRPRFHARIRDVHELSCSIIVVHVCICVKNCFFFPSLSSAGVFVHHFKPRVRETRAVACKVLAQRSRLSACAPCTLCVYTARLSHMFANGTRARMMMLMAAYKCARARGCSVRCIVHFFVFAACTKLRESAQRSAQRATNTSYRRFGCRCRRR